MTTEEIVKRLRDRFYADRDEAKDEIVSVPDRDCWAAADRLEALEAEVTRLREATPQWQQIETAPREERVIIAVPCKHAIDGWLIAEAYYRDEDDDEDGWWWANTGPYDVGECRLALSGHHPTHWMPLPPPPEAET